MYFLTDLFTIWHSGETVTTTIGFAGCQWVPSHNDMAELYLVRYAYLK